jgi:hypothetical protein
MKPKKIIEHDEGHSESQSAHVGLLIAVGDDDSHAVADDDTVPATNEGGCDGRNNSEGGRKRNRFLKLQGLEVTWRRVQGAKRRRMQPAAAMSAVTVHTDGNDGAA